MLKALKREVKRVYITEIKVMWYSLREYPKDFCLGVFLITAPIAFISFLVFFFFQEKEGGSKIFEIFISQIIENENQTIWEWIKTPILFIPVWWTGVAKGGFLTLLPLILLTGVSYLRFPYGPPLGNGGNEKSRKRYKWTRESEEKFVSFSKETKNLTWVQIIFTLVICILFINSEEVRILIVLLFLILPSAMFTFSVFLAFIFINFEDEKLKEEKQKTKNKKQSKN